MDVSQHALQVVSDAKLAAGGSRSSSTVANESIPARDDMPPFVPQLADTVRLLGACTKKRPRNFLL
jgi:hypothetical protein